MHYSDEECEERGEKNAEDGNREKKRNAPPYIITSIKLTAENDLWKEVNL